MEGAHFLSAASSFAFNERMYRSLSSWHLAGHTSLIFCENVFSSSLMLLMACVALRHSKRLV